MANKQSQDSGPLFEIRLKRADKIYKPGDVVNGVVLVQTKGPLTHQGITLQCDGVVQLQMSSKSVGLFEAFYNSIKPVTLLGCMFTVAKPGKLPDGVTEIPFEFKVEPLMGQTLYETYHGVFVNCTYTLKCDMKRGAFAKDMSKFMEIIVEIPSDSPGSPVPVQFHLDPNDFEKRIKAKGNLPKFILDGKIDTAICDIRKPITGSFTVVESECIIKSIELQLDVVMGMPLKVVYFNEIDTKNSETEIQNIQVADGDIAHGMELPMYMVLPRLFTCPTLATRTFKVEFEVNLVVVFEDSHMITKKFPIKVYRGK